MQRIYNAKQFCHTSNCCPVADLLDDGKVKIHDPDQKERGEFIMTLEEYNTFLKNAQIVA